MNLSLSRTLGRFPTPLMINAYLTVPPPARPVYLSASFTTTRNAATRSTFLIYLFFFRLIIQQNRGGWIRLGGLYISGLYIYVYIYTILIATGTAAELHSRGRDACWRDKRARAAPERRLCRTNRRSLAAELCPRPVESTIPKC